MFKKLNAFIVLTILVVVCVMATTAHGYPQPFANVLANDGIGTQCDNTATIINIIDSDPFVLASGNVVPETLKDCRHDLDADMFGFSSLDPNHMNAGNSFNFPYKRWAMWCEEGESGPGKLAEVLMNTNTTENSILRSWQFTTAYENFNSASSASYKAESIVGFKANRLYTLNVLGKVTSGTGLWHRQQAGLFHPCRGADKSIMHRFCFGRYQTPMVWGVNKTLTDTGGRSLFAGLVHASYFRSSEIDDSDARVDSVQKDIFGVGAFHSSTALYPNLFNPTAAMANLCWSGRIDNRSADTGNDSTGSIFAV